MPRERGRALHVLGLFGGVDCRASPFAQVRLRRCAEVATRAPPRTTRSAPTVAELCKKFIEDHPRQRNKPSTQVGYQKCIRNNIIPMLAA